MRTRTGLGVWMVLAAVSAAVVSGCASRAVVVVVDNSGSMGCHSPEGTFLTRAKAEAERLIGSLPPGTVVAVLTTTEPDAGGAFTPDAVKAAALVRDIKGTHSNGSVAPALRRARELLDRSGIAGPKSVHVLSDMTAWSWRDGSGADAATDADKEFTIVDCGGPATNAALGDLDILVRPGEREVAHLRIPAGSSGSRPVSMRMWTEQDGRREWTLLGGTPDTAEERAIRLSSETLRGGVALHGPLEDDALPMDNERYFTVFRPPVCRVLVAGEGDQSEEDMGTAFLVSAAIAPRPSPGDYRVTRVEADRLDLAALKASDITILADISLPGEAQWAGLYRYVQAGGRLWIIAGPGVRWDSYACGDAKAILPLELGDAEPLGKPVGFQADSSPLLTSFEPQARREIVASVRCNRRVSVRGTAPDAEVMLRYEDDVPAVARRRVGDGQVVLWNISPALEFSNLATSPVFVVLVHETLTAMRSSPRTMCLWGDEVRVPIPRDAKDVSASVLKPGEKDCRRIALPGGAKDVALRADRLGHWRVRVHADDQDIEHVFSVNAAAAESKLVRIDASKLRKMFPAGRMTVRAARGLGAPTVPAR